MLMSLKKKPFVAYKLKEERNPNERILPVRLNIEDIQMLDAIKESTGITEDSTALKVAARAGKNVLQLLFPDKELRLLFKKGRNLK